LSKSNTLHSRTSLLKTKWPRSPRTGFSSPTFLLSKGLLGHSLGVTSFGICLANLLSVLSVSVQVVQFPPLVIGSMEKIEYDKATSSTPLPPAKPYRNTTTGFPGRGYSHVKGDDNADTKLLSQPITFPFSGRTAPNRLLKAPMTECLCH
jgi:hypothetical protein